MDQLRFFSLRWRSLARRLAMLAIVCLAVSSCATEPDSPNSMNDPLEGFNRHVFAFNDAVDTVAIRPAAVLYRDTVPEPLKNIVSNFLDHLTLPLTIVHDLLQGKPDRAGIAAKRLFLNTTVGMAGLFDIATPAGFVYHQEDMGQTLGVYGVGPGPYLVLPFLGPSSVRDAAGNLVDRFIDPVSIATYAASSDMALRMGRTAASGLVEREKLIGTLDALRESLDYYATLRSSYRQRRESVIRDGRPPSPEEREKDPFADFE